MSRVNVTISEEPSKILICDIRGVELHHTKTSLKMVKDQKINKSSSKVVEMHRGS
jgi:hypothetical protein